MPTNQELIDSLFTKVEPEVSKTAIELQKIFGPMKWQWEHEGVKFSPSYVDIKNIITSLLKDLRIAVYNQNGPIRREQRFYMGTGRIIINIYFEDEEWQLTIGIDHTPTHIYHNS